MRRRFGPRLRRAILVWHRRLGLTAAPFVLVLVVTGVLLNRTDGLGLDRRTVDSAWLLDWYGIGADEDPVSFAAGPVWVSWLAGRLYLDGAAVADNAGPLAGAIWREPAVVAATAEAVYLFTADGALIEKARPVGVPPPIERLAAGPGETIVLGTASGAWSGDLDLGEWRETAPGAVSWARPAPAPAAVAERIARSYRGAGLPWERVLLDLHSGRLFGRFGSLVMDAAGVFLVLLAASGGYNWLQVRRGRRRRPRDDA